MLANGGRQLLIATARATCAWVVDIIATSEPFTTVYQTYLDKLRVLDAPS